MGDYFNRSSPLALVVIIRFLLIGLILSIVNQILVVFISLFVSSNVFGRDDSVTPIIGFMNHYPLVNVSAGGKISGAAPDYMNVVLKEANIEAPIIVYPISRLVDMFIEGELDITFLYKSAVMEPYVEFLGSLDCIAEYIVPRSGLQATSLEGLIGKTIGVTRGGYFSRKYENDERFTLVPTSDVRGLIKMAASGRIDSFAIVSSAYDIVLNDPMVSDELDIESIEDKFGAPIILEKFEFHLVMSKKSRWKELQPALSSAIRSSELAGKLSEVSKRYHISEMECD